MFMIADNVSSSDKIIQLGNLVRQEIDRLLLYRYHDKAEKIDRISDIFKGIPYNDKTLIGSKDVKEVFVINFKEVDCFTFIDYVEALSKSGNFDEFESSLRTVRYREGIVEFKNRRHFFTDWAYDKDAHAKDVTTLVGENNTILIQKKLNHISPKRFYLKGLPVVYRDIKYIPSKAVNRILLDKLKTGDYIGIYTHDKGLDVSHVGILIKDKDGKVLFRHASSLKGMVVEEPLIRYIRNKPGIVVLRTTD